MKKNNLKTDQDININLLAAKKWHYVHRRYRTPFFIYIIFDGASKHYNKQIKFPYEIKNSFDLDDELMIAYNNWEAGRKLIEKELKKNNKALLDIINISYALNHKIEKFGKGIAKRKFSSQTPTKELLKIIEEYLEYSLHFSAIMIFPLLFEQYLEKEIRRALKANFKGEALTRVEELFNSSIKLGSAQEEEISLLKLAVKKNVGQLKNVDINKHLKDFAWLKNVSMDGQFYSEQDILKQINSRAKNKPRGVLQLIYNKRKSFLKDQNKYRLLIRQNKTLDSYIDTLQEAIFFRSWRSERMYKNIAYFNNLWSEIASRLELKKTNDIFFLLPTEIISLLNNEEIANKKIIKERQSGFLLFADGVKTGIYSGEIVKEAKEKIKFLEDSEKDANTNNYFITGQKAYRGKVSGRVSLVTNKSEFSKMKKGNILVCRSTTPDYLPLIKKAAAIITDEGGVLSHASIISRELQKPCIIGTKYATKIFKDGDLVEVDADNGVIKKRR